MNSLIERYLTTSRIVSMPGLAWILVTGQAGRWAEELFCVLQGRNSAAEVSTDEEGEEEEEDADSEEADDEEWDPSLATPAVGRRRRARSDSQDATVGPQLLYLHINKVPAPLCTPLKLVLLRSECHHSHPYHYKATACGKGSKL